jgi:hypothetical protein
MEALLFWSETVDDIYNHCLCLTIVFALFMKYFCIGSEGRRARSIKVLFGLKGLKNVNRLAEIVTILN